jgi:IPT/TIG domain/Lipase (class 2)
LVARLFSSQLVTTALLLSCAASAAPEPNRPLTLHQTSYRIRAGQKVPIAVPSETLQFLRNAKSRSVRIGGTPGKGLVIAPTRRGDQVLLAASLRMKPGDYLVNISALSPAGEARQATVHITIDPLATVPATAPAPPVLLLNGWDFGCLFVGDAQSTFGNSVTDYLGNAPSYFFDNCVECPNCPIEDLGNSLGQSLSLITNDDGAAIPQFDLVTHSMGGLIARAYLSGLQSDGSLASPVNPRIRKLVEIATPNFGSFLAAELAPLLPGTQAPEMIPGSFFLWGLARWNQGADDLRGVDALAIIGNAGPINSSQNASDGLVSLTSGSLGFARDQSRTRILPYCHTDPIPGVDCAGVSIANFDEAPETGQIVQSFLADTPDWTSIGTTPDQDPYLSKYGGVFFAQLTAADQYVGDLTQVSFGTVALQPGAATGSIFYNEYLNGTGTFQAVSPSVGTLACGPFTEPAGYFVALRCKSGPAITSVGPLLSNVPGTVVISGVTLTIAGSGFGPQCDTCQLTVYPGAATLKAESWSDQTITATLPATFNGIAAIAVQAATGSDFFTFIAAPLR